MAVCKESFFKGIEAVNAAARLGDVGSAIQEHVEKNGFGVVKKYVGHGIGKELHESPDVPNYGTKGRGVRLCKGMTIAIEPMITAGSPDVSVLSDGWTVVTKDKSLSAHYEHTVAITDDGVILLTYVS